MSNTDTTAARSRYSTGAIILHWLIALGIIANWILAQYAEGLEEQKLEAAHQAAMGTHFAIGMSVLILSVARVAWRLMHKPPPPNPDHKPWERLLAGFVHKLFYVLIIALPFTGYMMLQTYMGGMGVSIFGVFEFPGIAMAKDMDANEVFHELHEIFATMMLVLFVLHVVGAWKHQLFDRDGTIGRMLPFGR